MPQKKHTYLKTHRLASKVIGFDTSAEEAPLRAQASRAHSGRAAKTMVKEGRLRVTLLALRGGTALGAHQVEGDVTLLVLRGQFEVRTKEGTIQASKGSVIALQAGVQHEARAVRDSTVLITASMR